MPQLYSSHSQKGAILVSFTILVIGLLAVAGLVLDLGNLYFTRIQLQKAADAGALGAIKFTFIDQDRRDPRVNDNASFVEQRAISIAVQTARMNRVWLQNHQVDAEYTVDSNGQFIMNLSVNHDRDFFLIDHVPFELLNLKSTASGMNISSQASSDRRIANVQLILDVSSSMACPKGDPDCECLTPARAEGVDCFDEAGGGNQRIDSLADAVSSFLEQFDEGRDRIGVTLFATAAKTVQNIKGPDEQGFDKDAILALLSEREPPEADGSPGRRTGDFRPEGATNLCDGMIRAFEDVYETSGAGFVRATQDGPKGRDDVAYVIFTDGAPTAARLFVRPARVGEDPGTPGGINRYLEKHEGDWGASDYDYTMQSIAWVAGNNTHQVGPGHLVKTGGFDLHYSGSEASVEADYPTCYDDKPEPFPRGMYKEAFSQCGINRLTFHLPWDESNRLYGAPRRNRPYLPGDVNLEAKNENRIGWQKQYYNCAIQLADYFRQTRGVVYVVGQGMPAVMRQNDPYQWIYDPNSRKDYLLNRVAYDYVQYKAQADAGRPYLDFNYTGYQRYDQLARKPSPRFGGYYKAVDDRDLEVIFQSIAGRILVRLTG